MGAHLILRTPVGDEPLDILEFEDRVRRGQLSPEGLVNFPAVTGGRFVPASELALFGAIQKSQRSYLGRLFGLRRWPWLTLSLVLGNVAVFFLTAMRGPLDLDSMVRFGGKVYPLVLDLGEIWRLLSANFLHRDFLHLALNMFVFANVGFALETVYRRSTYLLLLLLVAVATWVASLAASDAVSVGASGIVYGGLAALIGFGFRYRAMLPSRYRRLLGEAAMPTVIVLLWMGWTASGVDTAAHLGGLFAGGALSFILKPRLFQTPEVRSNLALRTAFGAALLGLVILALLFIAPHTLPIYRAVREEGLGVSLLAPVSWKREMDEAGSVTLHNGLPGYGLARLVISRRDAELNELVENTFRDLKAGMLGPAKAIESPVRMSLSRREARKFEVEIQHRSGKRRLIAYFVGRGQFVYEFLFTIPQAYPGYRRLASYVAEKIAFEEPGLIRQVRARVLLSPGNPWELGLLGNLLRQYGEPAEGARLLALAVQEIPSSVALRAHLSLALLDSGEIDQGCKAAADAAVYGPTNAEALEMRGRCELARGHASEALKFVVAARAYDPDNAHLKWVETRLRSELQALAQ